MLMTGHSICQMGYQPTREGTAVGVQKVVSQHFDRGTCSVAHCRRQGNGSNPRERRRCQREQPRRPAPATRSVRSRWRSPCKRAMPSMAGRVERTFGLTGVRFVNELPAVATRPVRYPSHHLIAASTCNVTIRDMSCSAHATQQILPPAVTSAFVRPAH